jgi:fluoroquinolone transport system permease protein
MYAFLLGALARNKVEGMSVTKLLSLLDFGPFLVWFLPLPWLWLAVPLPTVPAAKVAMDCLAGKSLDLWWPILAVLIAILSSWFSYRICRRRAEQAGGI